MMLASCTAPCTSQHRFTPVAQGLPKRHVLMCHLHLHAIYLMNSCDSLCFKIFFSGDLFKIALHGLPLAPFEVMMGCVGVRINQWIVEYPLCRRFCI